MLCVFVHSQLCIGHHYSDFHCVLIVHLAVKALSQLLQAFEPELQKVLLPNNHKRR